MLLLLFSCPRDGRLLPLPPPTLLLALTVFSRYSAPQIDAQTYHEVPVRAVASHERHK
jgi:hypothetical protein